MWLRISRQASALSFRSVGSWLSAARMNERASSAAKPPRASTCPATRESPSSREIASATSTEKASQVQREGRESTRAILGSGVVGTGGLAPIDPAISVETTRRLAQNPDDERGPRRCAVDMTESVLSIWLQARLDR